jgi:hypothetical protein
MPKNKNTQPPTKIDIGWASLEISENRIDVTIRYKDMKPTDALVRSYDRADGVDRAMLGTCFSIQPYSGSYDPASHDENLCKLGGCVGCESPAYRATKD